VVHEAPQTGEKDARRAAHKTVTSLVRGSLGAVLNSGTGFKKQPGRKTRVVRGESPAPVLRFNCGALESVSS
jgi:hypothetical protein